MTSRPIYLRLLSLVAAAAVALVGTAALMQVTMTEANVQAQNTPDADSATPVSRDRIREEGTSLAKPGMHIDEVVRLFGEPDDRTSTKLSWKVGLASIDQLWFIVEHDEEGKVVRAYQPVY